MTKRCLDFEGYPSDDRQWSEDNWRSMVEQMVDVGLISWSEIASSMLGLLNPPQVGTAIASNSSFKSHYPSGQMWSHTREWLYSMNGRCADCGTKIDLQGDHIIPRETLGGAADYLDNMTLRCRRHNVAKRPSHKNAGKTFLTAQSALMWLLLVFQPPTYQKFKTLCRDYGLTMAAIRFEEAWAQARWLAKEGLYYIDEQNTTR